MIDRLAYLQRLKARAEHLIPGDVASRLATTFDGTIATLKDPEKAAAAQKAQNELLAAARDERMAKIINGPKQAELNALRVTTVENFLMASSNVMAFFNPVTLADDEEPWFEYTTKEEVGVSYIGQDGKARRLQIGKADVGGAIPLHILSTDEVEYKIRDIYRGEQKSAALALIDLARDMQLKIDAILWPMVKALIGTFPTGGDKRRRVYNAHSSVKTANLPTTNLLEPLDPSGNARNTSDVFDLECWKAIIKYAGKWGANAFMDGELRPATVYIPSGDMFGWLDFVDADTRETSVTKQIFDTGYVVSFGGATLTMVGDNTLDPDEGKAYISFNKPVGDFYTKPGMDETFIDDGIDNRKQNIETISMNKVIAGGIPDTKKVNVACVQYKAAS